MTSLWVIIMKKHFFTVIIAKNGLKKFVKILISLNYYNLYINRRVIKFCIEWCINESPTTSWWFIKFWKIPLYSYRGQKTWILHYIWPFLRFLNHLWADPGSELKMCGWPLLTTWLTMTVLDSRSTWVKFVHMGVKSRHFSRRIRWWWCWW